MQGIIVGSYRISISLDLGWDRNAGNLLLSINVVGGCLTAWHALFMNPENQPGYRFKDGKLMIFREDEVMLIRGWDEPSALRKDGGGWEQFEPAFRLVAPYRRAARTVAKKPAKETAAEPVQMAMDFWTDTAAKKPVPPRPPSLVDQRKRAFDSFRFSLPKEVANALEGFRSNQWRLLNLLAMESGCIDLASSNPVLAYALADWRADRNVCRQPLGRMPQRELLALLKLPDTAAMVKLFRKIPPESLDPRLWQPLLGVLRQPDGTCAKWLAHVPVINLGVMELILPPQIRVAVTPTLLEEVSADPKEKYRGNVAGQVRDTLAMMDELEHTGPLVPIPSIARLREIHERVSAEFRKLEALRRQHGPLPLPPLPGIKDRIIPLRTQAELVAEGREQKNCVASYAARVVAGECYIYRVLQPARATLSIRRQTDGNWGIAELLAACNRPVDKATRETVGQWLEPYRLGVADD